jgi:hypothetical protein
MFKKKGQVTIFIIIGIVVLFAFLFVFMLSSQVTKGKLEGQRDAIYADSFKKESLRIFVEDCLKDELERGLITYGAQGKFFSDDPGGILNFAQGENGILFGAEEDKVYYAIKDEEYSKDVNAYPCDDDVDGPYFCEYGYPDSSVGFGVLKMKSSSMDRDLKNFLKDRARVCVLSFTKEELSSQIEIIEGEEDIEMELIMSNDAISVDVNYPITMRVSGNDFFHLAKFDFVYPTKFKQFLNAAILFPLRLDQKYVDFNYGEESEIEGEVGDLKKNAFVYKSSKELSNCEADAAGLFDCTQPMFSENYENLKVELDRFEQENGDDVFEFKSPFPNVVRVAGDYVFRFARENRPPALDDVSRAQCRAGGEVADAQEGDEVQEVSKEYDYLVIKGDEDFGGIEINLNAIDPDEDEVDYDFEGEMFGGVFDDGKLIVEQVDLDKGEYNFRAIARDEHGKEDFQNVRVIVDRPILTSINIDYPELMLERVEEGVKSYVAYGDVFDNQGEQNVFVSQRDPFCLNVRLPEGSQVGEGIEDFGAELKYKQGEEESRLILPDQIASSQGDLDPYGFPLENNQDGLVASCNVDNRFDSFSSGEVLDIDFESFPFESVGEANLELIYGVTYCGLEEKQSVSKLDVNVAECIPHRNLKQPFAAPYHEYYFEDGYDLSYEDWEKADNFYSNEGNVYTATRACCLGSANNPGSWRLATGEDEETCFVNPEPDCYGGVKKNNGQLYTGVQNLKGIVLEKQVAICGDNGVCGGDFKNELYNNRLTCGSQGFDGCQLNKIDGNCDGELGFSLFENQGWCHGTFGCTDFCDSEIVYTGRDRRTNFEGDTINRIASIEKFVDEGDMNLDCGCPRGEVRAGEEDGLTNIACDSNFDGRLGGKCSIEGVCVGDN